LSLLGSAEIGEVRDAAEALSEQKNVGAPTSKVILEVDSNANELQEESGDKFSRGGVMRMLRVGLLLMLGMCAGWMAVGQEHQTGEKPETPIEAWKGKTVMLIGAHADDDALAHGTLAILQAHGNQVYVVTLTTGNVGTQDAKLSRTQLAEIRRQEELASLAELGIPGEHYINLGYDDGMLEFEDRKAVVENLVRLIRKLRPDVLFAWDPGKNYQRWHKSDHRAAAYLAADAARAAMWRLLFEGQITQEGLKEYLIPEYLLYNDYDHGDENVWVDISAVVEKVVNSDAKYMSQFGPGWKNYNPNPSEREVKEMKESVRKFIRTKDGKSIEGFRYYRGLPDGIGK
jgi:LmbE family N-acetylglucosaminyl deacetylase